MRHDSLGGHARTTTEVLLLTVFDVLSGSMDGVVGGGTLLSFALLLNLGVPPVCTSATNTAARIPRDVNCAVIHRRKLQKEDSKTVRTSHWQQASGPSLARRP